MRKEKLGGSVAIGNLERYCADFALDNDYRAEAVSQSINKKVAVVGSGPASLSCAADLARAGVKVTIFEALHEAGGVLVYGIPEFRLPKSLVKKEIENVRSLGVDIETDVVVGKTVFLDELLAEYDAVFIGSGAGVPMFFTHPRRKSKRRVFRKRVPHESQSYESIQGFERNAYKTREKRRRGGRGKRCNGRRENCEKTRCKREIGVPQKQSGDARSKRRNRARRRRGCDV